MRAAVSKTSSPQTLSKNPVREIANAVDDWLNIGPTLIANIGPMFNAMPLILILDQYQPDVVGKKEQIKDHLFLKIEF